MAMLAAASGATVSAEMLAPITTTLNSNGCTVACWYWYHGYYDWCVIDSQNHLQVLIIEHGKIRK